MPETFVDLAIPAAVDKLFTYSVPRTLAGSAIPGVRALVPFGNKKAIGIIVARLDTPPGRAVRPIDDVLDHEPAVKPGLMRLAAWISSYYHAPIGEVLRAMFVPGQVGVSRTVLRPVPGAAPDGSSGAVFAAILSRKKITVPALMKAVGSKSVYGAIGELRRGGLISVEEQPPSAPRARRGGPPGPAEAAAGGPQETAPDLVPEPIAGLNPGLTLNEHQRSAAASLREAVAGGAFSAFLLRGVTGSGKTEVYIEAIREAMARGKSSIVLVPEIALTPQTSRRFRAAFGDLVSLFHSRMSAGERHATWRKAREDSCRVIIGPRSAVFAPLPNLGLLIVDEEHDGSYKSDLSPRYHARDVAVIRAKFEDAVVVLGSATPSLESYANAVEGKYRLLELPERVDGSALPEVVVVDMAAERNRKFEAYRAARKDEHARDRAGFRKRPGGFAQPQISDLLLAKIKDRLGKKEGVLLLHNRRGFASYLECPDCAAVEMCPQCGISMTYHRGGAPQLRCHYCASARPAPLFCLKCGSGAFRLRGAGIQRIEDELAALLPGASIGRMDSDTVSRRGSHGKILGSFESGETDILIGTQMIAKGLDIARVTLVGVISADTQLLLPDFRSAERTFQLLTQVAGRSGRRRVRGEVVIQTMHPENPALMDASRHDYGAFFRDEMRYRKELSYPPWTRLTLVEFSGKNAERVRSEALRFATAVRKQAIPATVLGPAPAALGRLRGNYRWQLIVKADRERDPSGAAVREFLERAARPGRSPVKTAIVSDPQSMM